MILTIDLFDFDSSYVIIKGFLKIRLSSLGTISNVPWKTFNKHVFYRWAKIKLYVDVFAACDEEWRRVAVAAAAETQRLLSPAIPGLATPLRTPATPLGAPLILSPRMSVPTTAASILNGSAPPGSLLSPADPHLIYAPYTDYQNYALAASPLLADYTTADHSGGLFARWLYSNY